MKKGFVLIVLASTLVLAGCGMKKKAVVLEDNMPKNEPQQETMVKSDENISENTSDSFSIGTGTTGEMMKKDDAMMKKDDVMQKEPVMEKPAPAKGMYQSYSPDAVKQYLASGKKVMLFFYAARCPSCRTLDKELITQADKIPANSVVLKVNYDTESDLKKTFGVTSQHTLVYIDKNMKTLFKQSGGDISSIASILK